MLVRILAVLSLCFWSADAADLSFRRGAINAVTLGDGTAVYGGSGSYLLLAHGRRDAVGAVPSGTKVIAPTKSKPFLEGASDYWKAFPKARFHDYGQQSTKVHAAPVVVDRWVAEGEVIDRHGGIRVLETPGYTRDSVTYLATVDGLKTAFTGDLIYGDGQLFDLYSFQDEIAKAKIRGYHGYAARLADLVVSLKKVAEEKPDRLVPMRGPIIENPQAAIAKLIRRVQALYKNYLSTNALHWYFKEDRMRFCGQRVIGDGDAVELMPYSRHEKIPDWIFSHSTSRLLISETGAGFLLDCGGASVISEIKKLIADGRVKSVEGIFSTHFHDDHTDALQRAAEAFGCPVYAVEEYADVIAHPGRYHLPALTSHPVKDVRAVPDGHLMKWHEFALTFHFFPGQTFYHGALHVEKKGEAKPIFFVGDSFAPSGFDDYCLMNRNLVHDDWGYFLCLKKVRALETPAWLMNQHIGFVFDYTKEEFEYLESRYRERRKMLAELFPWDDPNYGIDEQWAVFYPRVVEFSEGEEKREIQLRITNHSPAERLFKVTVAGEERELRIAPRGVGTAAFEVRHPEKATALVTADIRSQGMEFLRWAEALLVGENR